MDRPALILHPANGREGAVVGGKETRAIGGTCGARRELRQIADWRSDIHIYTEVMKILKIRRVGHNNAVSLPHELEQRGHAPGASAMIEELEGELRVIPADRARALIREAARRVIAEDQEALRILAEHERAELPPSRRAS